MLDKRPLADPGRGFPSYNKWRLWWDLFFTTTDILTTWGTQRPAHPLMDQTQWPQLGPFYPWSPPDVDDWPESSLALTREGTGDFIDLFPLPSLFPLFNLPYPIFFSSVLVLDTGVCLEGLSLI